MARASVDVQTDINNTQKNISDLDDQINSCNAEIQNLETRIAELENEKNIISAVGFSSSNELSSRLRRREKGRC